MLCLCKQNERCTQGEAGTFLGHSGLVPSSTGSQTMLTASTQHEGTLQWPASLLGTFTPIFYLSPLSLSLSPLFLSLLSLPCLSLLFLSPVSRSLSLYPVSPLSLLSFLFVLSPLSSSLSPTPLSLSHSLTQHAQSRGTGLGVHSHSRDAEKPSPPSPPKAAPSSCRAEHEAGPYPSATGSPPQGHLQPQYPTL